MIDATPAPHAGLRAALARVRRQWRRVAVLAATSRVLVAAALILVAAAAVERALPIGDGAAIGLGVAAVVAIVAAGAIFLSPLRRRPSDRQVARFVEERLPECGDAIATAVEILERPRGGEFAPLVVADAERRLSAANLEDVVDRAAARRVARRLVVAAIACLLAFVFAAPLADRAAEVAYVRLFPSSIRLTVAPGDMRVAAGRPATIVASLTGRAGALARVSAQITLDADGRRVTLPMERAGDGYRFTVPSVDRSFHYAITAGPAASRAYSVTALHPARVERIDLQYDFPAFTGLTPRLERDGGDVYAPAGTRVRVIVHADHPVHDGALAFSQGQPPSPLVAVDDRTLAASLTVADDAAYRIALVDHDGLRSESVEYFLRVMDDRPPEIHILRPGGDEGITPLQEVPIEARADDDYGIAKMDLVYSVAGGPERIVPFASTSGTDLARVGAHMLAAEDLKVKPGDVIAYYARAWDVPRAKQSTMTRSELFFLEVKPFNEEYSLAVSQAGMQAATATQLDGLISAQKEIISATWNIERRSGAGRSTTDVKGVADAQVELKGRAERAAGAQQQRRRFGGGFPPAFAFGFGGAARAFALGSGAASQAGRRQDPSQTDGDPVLKAVDAMGRAAQELQGQKTAGAIPHEMAALNALLQAQAEIRQKQIAQQQGNGGGAWGNRQGQDLSSLFDRELKRQQKSNYENEASVESTPEPKPGESALDRIRDLARRQEELTRQQRELAKNGLSTEEAKRQLEKLTREQEEMRRQLEAAQKGQGSGGEARSAKAAAAGANELQEALQRMREAAAQGQQADASGAAAKGEQAAEALRRAEAQMQNGSPDAQKRALGDLQLEAQQMAQAQQRIADEAARLDREGGGTADARRRLASDKERLADRVDALQQAAGRLPAAGEAARDLASQQIGNRMRSAAQQLRAAGDAHATTAAGEQQMAEALDRIARTIGAPDAGGAKGDKADANSSRQLGGELDELRDARERVARLERQMRDLQARGLSPEARSAKGDARDGRGARGDVSVAAVAELQRQLDQELQRAREVLSRARRDGGDSGGNAATPEGHEWSRSAPGTEAFKQDYATWQSLASDVARALERAESSAASKLSAALARDRLRAGGSERVPDAYRRQVSRYFESIAVKQGPGRQ